MLEHGELAAGVEPSAALLAAIAETADALGLTPAAVSRVRVPSLDERSRATFHADLFALRPSWWRASRGEEARTLGASSEASDAALVTVDRELAQSLLYAPLRKAAGGPWLFAELPHALGMSQAGTRVLVAEPEAALLHSLPPAVASLLRTHSGCLALAGGAVLGGVSRFVQPGSDLDLFIYGLDAADSARVLALIEASVKVSFRGEYAVTRSVAAVTFTHAHKAKAAATGPQGSLAFRPFQVVLGVHRARSQVLEYFDLAPTKVLARFDATGALIVEALPAFVEALRAMAFWVDPLIWSRASTGRIVKYIAKGFEVAVPGVRREAFRVACGERSLFPRKIRQPYWSGGKAAAVELPGELCSEGFGVLFDAEDEVMRCHHTPDKDFDDLGGIVQIIKGRLSGVEASTIASKISGTLGTGGGSGSYSFLMGGSSSSGNKPTCCYGFIRELFRRSVAVQIGDERRGVTTDLTDWTFRDFLPWVADKPGRFLAADVRLRELHDEAKFELLAAAEAEARQARVAAARAAGPAKSCSACGAAGAAHCCSACRAAWYCGRECQAAHWKAAAPAGHKGACKALAAAAAAAAVYT